MASYGWNPGMPRDAKVKGLRLKSPLGKNVIILVGVAVRSSSILSSQVKVNNR